MRIPCEVLSHMNEDELRNYSSMIDYSNERVWEIVYLQKQITQMLEDLRKMEKRLANLKELNNDANLDIRNFENKIMKKYEEFMPVASNETMVPNFKGGALGENACQ